MDFIRVKNILEGLITSETSTGHPKHREYIAGRLGTTPDMIEQSAKNIIRQGKALTDIERELVRCILEDRYNRYKVFGK